MAAEKLKQVIHVEVCLASSCVMPSEVEDVMNRVRKAVLTIGKVSAGEMSTVKEFCDVDPSLTSLISSLHITSTNNTDIINPTTHVLNGFDMSQNETANAVVNQPKMVDSDPDGNSDPDGDGSIELRGDNLLYHFYRLNNNGPSSEDMYGSSCGEDDNDSSGLSVTSQWILPAVEFQGLWENLIYDTNIKSKLLNYVSSTMLFSDKGINSNIITWNRVVLLHGKYYNSFSGPPGTGKTSLCRALAQKLTILLNDRYTYGHLIEVNSHSLFSKWFSESGKLVLKMFQSIRAIVEDSDGLVVLLIDEVESLTNARKSALAGTEPSDAIRVVNALLTQIDQIRRFPNVIILTTSNMTAAIDLAFVDRADIKQYVGLPSVDAIYQIYESCIVELMKRGIISHSRLLLNIRNLKMTKQTDDDWVVNLSRKLYAIAKKSVGFSGRTLRKMPLLAHALFLQRSSVLLEQFIEALFMAVERQLTDQQEFNMDS